MSAKTSSSSTTAPFFSFGPDDSFISKSAEGLRYRHLPKSLKNLITDGKVLDVHWASLGPIPESWILSFTDSTHKHNLAWGQLIPPRLQTYLSKLTPSPFLRAFLGPGTSYIAWDADSIRWTELPTSLEDSIQAWLTPSGWKNGPPRMVTWGESDAFFAMSEYGDVAYRVGGKAGERRWEIWKETVEEWRGEAGFVWSEVAYISIDPTTPDQFVAIRNDGTWAGSIDDINEEALEAFAVNFFRLAKPKTSSSRPHTNGYHHPNSNSHSQSNGTNDHRSRSGPHPTNGNGNSIPRPRNTTPDAATQAQYESWANNTASLFASALAANNTAPRKAPKKLQIRSQTTTSTTSPASPSPSIPTSATTIGQGRLLSSFPYLPPAVTRCSLPACAIHKSDPQGLRACKHDVERLLRASGLYSYEWLRQERIRWHPDRFGRLCEERWREEGKRLAEEMFKIIDILIGEVKG
ncbi:hypothetical protein CC80DRAFT_266203 [Byssothecium circinans]|uniref:Uncharacterized protein n=1 Tax=Byssothecium circinans TaxID=147558 RepID=A0A6A5U7G1_9PLEO|nr:hypothetical protein CC80DRAFT_266203 [Byssothecium circinans]